MIPEINDWSHFQEHNFSLMGLVSPVQNVNLNHILRGSASPLQGQ